MRVWRADFLSVFATSWNGQSSRLSPLGTADRSPKRDQVRSRETASRCRPEWEKASWVTVSEWAASWPTGRQEPVSQSRMVAYSALEAWGGEGRKGESGR